MFRLRHYCLVMVMCWAYFQNQPLQNMSRHRQNLRLHHQSLDFAQNRHHHRQRK
jgi:hypothetical protein